MAIKMLNETYRESERPARRIRDYTDHAMLHVGGLRFYHYQNSDDHLFAGPKLYAFFGGKIFTEAQIRNSVQIMKNKGVI